MLKKDYSTSNDIPIWINHDRMEFKSNDELMQWVSDDKTSFNLSRKVYRAMIDCLNNNIDAVIVVTLSVLNESMIDVLIRKENFQKILSAYTKRLIEMEDYEKLAEIKNEVDKFGLEIT
jgi:hypothetical protein